MALVFDSLGYSRKLREAGVAQEQAEAMADAAREYIMLELVTRHDLDTVRRELEAAIKTETLHLTIRMGAMLAVAVAALATLVRLT